MSSTRRAGRSIEQVLDLLNDSAFCDDARRFTNQAAALFQQKPTQAKWLQRMTELRAAFVARWGVPPPQTRELVDPDSRRHPVEAIGSGRWGIVQVFPWTTDREIRTVVKTIRQCIRRRHQDALERRAAQLIAWLEACDFARAEIARVVLKRRRGLKRPTTAEAIARNPETRESELYREYERQARARGIRKTAIQGWVQQRVYRRLRGTEAPANAAVRMADRRYRNRIERLNKDLDSPIASEPVSHALTLLFGALPDQDDGEVRQRVDDVRAALVGDRRQQAAVGQPVPAKRHTPLNAIESEDWGVVPVFPWTTDAIIQELVKKIRAKIRGPRRPSGADRIQSPAASTEPEPFSRAITRLLQALGQEDDAGVRRPAEALRASFARSSSS